MKTNTITKWGNSFGVRIPKDLVTSLNLKHGSQIAFKKVDGNILMSPSKPKYTLDDFVKSFSLKKLHVQIFPDDVPRGQEIW